MQFDFRAFIQRKNRQITMTRGNLAQDVSVRQNDKKMKKYSHFENDSFGNISFWNKITFSK